MFNPLQLIRSPWAEAFSDFVRSIRSEAIVAAPFIGAGTLEYLSSMLNPDQPPKIDLITNLAVNSLLNGTADTEAIAGFSRKLSSVTVRNLTGLHAKVYIADENMAIITSGNMTQASLYRNYEYGVRITDPVSVRQIAADIREYSSLGTEVSLSELDKLTEIARTLQQKYTDALNTAGHQANREFRDEIETAREDLLNLRANSGESENAIFARTILYVLKQGSLSTVEMHPIIESLQPDLCDDSIYRVINGVRHGRRWKHMVRRAQQHLRDRGVIEYVNRKWRLV